MKKEISHYFQVSKSLVRIPTYLLLSLHLLVGTLGGIYAHSTVFDIKSFIVCAFYFIVCELIIAFWYMNATALNDYADYEIDLINLKNDKDRPLVIGLSNKKELLKLAYIYGFLVVVLAAIISINHVILVILLLMLNYSYSIKPIQISRRGILAPLLLPLAYITLPYSLGFGITGWELTRTSWLIMFGLYLQFIGRIILKDYRDVKGDKKHGKITPLLQFGNSAVCIVSGLSILGSLLIFLSAFYKNIYYIPFITFTTYGLTILYYLSKTNDWKKQKPLLSAFGRIMTGSSVTIIAILTTLIWDIPSQKSIILSFLLVGVYLYSANQAFTYNTINIAAEKTKS